MATPFRNQENKTALPQLRKNKHFRIKSTSKDKIFGHGQLLSVRSKHKVADASKRIFSQSRTRKSGSFYTAIKIKITKEELEKRFVQFGRNTVRKKMIVYEGVKTENHSEAEEFQSAGRIKTINLDQNVGALNKIARICDPNRIMNRENIDASHHRQNSDSNCFKKIKFDRDSNQLKEPKGKYRCRVNQYIFEKKKSNLGKKEEEQFWKNVNESLILPATEEEPSKDLREFVYDNFVTE